MKWEEVSDFLALRARHSLNYGKSTQKNSPVCVARTVLVLLQKYSIKSCITARWTRVLCTQKENDVMLEGMGKFLSSLYAECQTEVQ